MKRTSLILLVVLALIVSLACNFYPLIRPLRWRTWKSLKSRRAVARVVEMVSP